MTMTPSLSAPETATLLAPARAPKQTRSIGDRVRRPAATAGPIEPVALPPVPIRLRRLVEQQLAALEARERAPDETPGEALERDIRMTALVVSLWSDLARLPIDPGESAEEDEENPYPLDPDAFREVLAEELERLKASKNRTEDKI
jgi:hypothetical protein